MLILLHGATGNGRMWDPVRRSLDPRWVVLTPDLPGHGARRNEPYTLAGAVSTALECARSVPDAPLVLGGDSLGGYSSIAAASALPSDRLRGLILGGCSLNYVGSPLRALRWRGLIGNCVTALLGENRFTHVLLTKELRRAGLADTDIDSLIGAGIHPGAFKQAVEAIANVDFRSKVAAIEQPILFLNGERDKPAFKHEAEFVACARSAESRHFDCEHGVSIRCPRGFAAATDEFVARVCGLSQR